MVLKMVLFSDKRIGQIMWSGLMRQDEMSQWIGGFAHVVGEAGVLTAEHNRFFHNSKRFY